ncbi:unnamed protein product [Phytophthora lilii]|uniref:Unnamed protein product n=1 Tax=Phytophthora lilii TaxID=2077276 RepID=A0A9W6TP32_9STRA|nr:unnamed protein product [Phytophthora lilii]
MLGSLLPQNETPTFPSLLARQPNVDWKRRCFKDDESSGASTADTSTPCGKFSQANGSGLHDAVDSESSSTRSLDSCRAAVPEMRPECEVKTAERPAGDVIETKYITREKLRKFLRLPAKDQPEHDFMIVLTNDTIKEIERDIKRNDEPDNVGSEKTKRFLQTDWDPFKDNPAFPVLKEYNDTEFKPELPDRLPMERTHPPKYQPTRSTHLLCPETCWMAYRRLPLPNTDTVRQSVPMTRKEDMFDSMVGAYYFSCMDLMSAYYQVRMKTDHIKYTVFQPPSGLYEYLVLPMGVSNAPATMHRLTSSLFKGLPHTRSFYDDIYIFTKSKDIAKHLQALREVLEILKVNKLYVKLFKCVFCDEEIPCLGGFIGRNVFASFLTRCR